MKRISCKSTLAGTVAHSGSNIKNGKHVRASEKRAKRASAK